MISIPDNELEYIYHLGLKKYKEFMPDIIANTVMNMIRYHDKYDPSKGKRTTWIYAIMKNIAIKMLDKKIKDRAVIINVFSDFESEDDYKPAFGVSYDNLELIEFRDDVNRVLHKLTGRQKEFVELVMAGFSIEDIAHLLGMSNRKSYFELEKRTRNKLKEILCV